MKFPVRQAVFPLPELLNRLDNVVVFHQLHREELIAIVEEQIREVEKRLAEQEISLAVSCDVKMYLVVKGYSPIYGARPLRRLIEQEIENPISEILLSQHPASGSQIVVTQNGDDLAISCLEKPVLHSERTAGSLGREL